MVYVMYKLLEEKGFNFNIPYGNYLLYQLFAGTVTYALCYEPYTISKKAYDSILRLAGLSRTDISILQSVKTKVDQIVIESYNLK